MPQGVRGVIIEKDKIVDFIYDRLKDEIGAERFKVIDASGLSLLPGFIDCHLHITGLSQGLPVNSWLLGNREERLIRSLRQSWELLIAGFTTVVDNSPHGPVLRDMIHRGEIFGPDIIPCNKGLAATGGAGYIPHASETELLQKHPWAITCDGVENLRAEVRRLRKDGADWIKVWISGAGMHERDIGEDIQYSQEEVIAIVKEAHRYGLKVQGHCFCGSAVKIAIHSGVDCVVHGNGLDEESKKLFLDSDAVWIPTLSIFQVFNNPEGRPLEEFPDISEHYANVLDFNTRKRPLALGSDTFADDKTPYGSNGLREIKELVNTGLSPMDAIKIATYSGAKLLEAEKEKGVLMKGAKADLILMKGRPDKDISLFDDVENVVFVMHKGRIAKDSLNLMKDNYICYSPFISG